MSAAGCGGRYIPASGEHPVGTSSQDTPMGFPTGGHGPPITWDPAHGVWRPPGFNPDPSDPSRLFNSTTGQNAVWDDKAGAFIDTKTGAIIGYGP